MSIPAVQPSYSLPQPAYNLPPTNEQQAPSPSEVAMYAPQTQTGLSTHMRPVSHGWPESTLQLIAANPTPLVLPPSIPGFVKRNVPQRVWDPYADRRSGKNAKDVVIHYFPNGVTTLDTQRIEFDIAGQRSGTGIPLSLLGASHISSTLHYLVDANEPILIDRQRMEGNECVVDFGHSYNNIILCMAYAQANPYASAGASSEDTIWAFGPGRLSFDRVRLVALYQMAGQYFLGEFNAEIPQELWDRRLNAAAVPMTY
ncbi:hypothetical protein DAEQUDRAFT_767768 [Daedalea quercina L-15889]|uniref:Uncharacterized protein n=1 Tax=Daedalea quercina L-15889 TaxID=1314783 RepID=A0A165N910_9APHY|nr:hypothetical protein DAEQUDRAFT_767768 [Daedalea quercina L-15889]